MKANEWTKWAEELNKRISEWIGKEALRRGDDYVCKRCGKTLMNRIVHSSIHDGFSLVGTHSGSGKVHKFSIPECPNKDCPNHKPSFWDEHLQLDEKTNTMYGPCYDK